MADEESVRIKQIEAELKAAKQDLEDAEEAVEDARAVVHTIEGSLRAAKVERDKKLPQCEMAANLGLRESTVRACIVGKTPSGLLRVRVLGADKVELFKRQGNEYVSRGEYLGWRDRLKNLPPEYAIDNGSA